MPLLPTRRALSASRRRRALASPALRPSVVVLGDLVLDVVIAPDRALEPGSDVTGQVRIRQGGSAASAARWLGRIGARSSLICAIGRDSPGRALVAALAADGVTVRAVRVAGARTGRIGVVVDASGQRSFVTERGAALRLRPEDLRPGWFEGAGVLHLPAYSLLDRPLGDAGLAAIGHARAAGARVTVDLASAAPLLAQGRDAALLLLNRADPDLLFSTADEARALLGPRRERDLLDLAPVAIVKRGREGATILARDGRERLRFEVATTPIQPTDTTGAGDAFDAGFLAGWLEALARGLAPVAALQRGALLGNRTAHRHLSAPPGELPLG
jgi:sugar/nucleoside kinase (ribokinase family)